MLTPETLPKHELVGLHAEVLDSTDPGLVGIAGEVVRETMKTLVIRSDSGVSTVPKAGTTMTFAIDEAAAAQAVGTPSELPLETAGRTGQSGGCEGVAYVTVDGGVLLSRPALRTELGVDSKWR